MSDSKELQRIGRALIDIVKKATDAAAKATDPVNKSMFMRIAVVNNTISEAIAGAIQHEDSKTSKREAEGKEGTAGDGHLRVEP